MSEQTRSEGTTGSIPPKTYYDPEGMKTKDKETFEEWYGKQTGKFDMQKELED